MKRCLNVIAVGVMFVAVIGCGEEPRSDFPQEEPDVAFAKGVKADMRDLRMQFHRRDVGLSGLGSVLESYVENYENIEQEPLGEHRETYLKIRDGLLELRKMVQSRPSQKEVSDKLDELVALSDKLPGGEPGGEGSDGQDN